MARRAFWPTLETSEATIFARGNVTPAVCGPAPTDCCGTTVPGSTLCCPDGFDQTILFAAFGPLGAGYSLELLQYELNWDNERRSWIGGAEGAGGEAIVLEIWCEEDDEFGQVWWLAGSYFAVALGVRVPFMVWGIVPANGLIVSDIEVPGSATPLTVVIAHPCSDLEPGGGSGSGGVDPVACPGPCGPTLAQVFDKTGGATCLPNLLIYNGATSGNVGQWTSASCPGNILYELRCVSGVYKFYAGATECALLASDGDPFSMTFQLPDLGANVGGSGTAKVKLMCAVPCPGCLDSLRTIGVSFGMNNLSGTYSGTGGSGSLALDYDSDDFDWDGTLYGSVVSVANECSALADANRWQITVGGVLIQDDIIATSGSSDTVSVTFSVPYSAFASPPGGATGNVTLTVTGTLCTPGSGGGGPAPQPSYCLTSATISGLTLAPKTATSWWSDHAGSWILTRVSSLGWRLTNPRGDVFFSGSWDGTGSKVFEGIYTVTLGACP